MLKLMKSLLVLSTVASFALTTACASKIDKAEIAATSNPAEEVPRLEEAYKQAINENVDVLAPEDFDKGMDSYKDARNALSKNKKQEKILEYVAYSTAYLNKAKKTADVRRPQVQTILEARTAALQAGANKTENESKALGKLDSEVRDASDRFDKNLNPEDVSRIQRGYMALEVASAQVQTLGEARSKIVGSRKNGAEKRTPSTLAQADVDLRNAENIVAQNVKNPSAYNEAVTKANESAQLLVDVLATAKKNGDKTTEGVALQLVKQGRTLKEQSGKVALQQALEKARKTFSKDEAEVFQQGDTLLIRLKTMNFKVGTADLPQESLDVLSKVGGVIETLPSDSIVVEGHTDSTGSAPVNEKLSQTRAETVAKYLETNGEVKTPISAVGYGFKKPISSNKSKQGRAQNRRVDVVIKAKSSKTAQEEAQEKTESNTQSSL